MQVTGLQEFLERIEENKGDAVIALAGNPNTGKSTVFNSLTGLNQHTGNWPGKTVVFAKGATGIKRRTLLWWIARRLFAIGQFRR